MKFILAATSFIALSFLTSFLVTEIVQAIAVGETVEAYNTAPSCLRRLGSSKLFKNGFCSRAGSSSNPGTYSRPNAHTNAHTHSSSHSSSCRRRASYSARFYLHREKNR
ncbi:MAG: hypothetical protein HYR95_02000 [Candidatus Colwellbacteria bacterium]|nr:hypothetical protein [Candidatus Colwellbacteria bacterium]